MRNNRRPKTEVRGQKSEDRRQIFGFFCSLFSVFCFLVFLTLIGCAKHEIKNSGTKGKNIICFGDSVTFGYGVGPGQDYPTELAKLLKLPVINAGVDADTTFFALDRLDNDVLVKNPRLVIVEFCGNDFIKKIPREDTLKNLSKIHLLSQKSRKNLNQTVKES